MKTIVNFDCIAPDDKEVSINGKIYKIQGDMPVKYMINAIKYSKTISDDPNDINSYEKFMETLFGILKLKNDISRDEFDKIGFKKAVALYSYIYAGISPEDTMKTIEVEQNRIKQEKKNQE